MQLTQEQVKRMKAKDVEKFYKRYETYVGAKTTESFVDSFVWSYTSVVSAFLPIKDVQTLQRELKKDYELSTLVGGLAVRCGRLFMVANTALITAKHVDFSAAKNADFSAAPGHDADGYLLSGIDEVPSQQSSATAEQSASIAE